MDKALEEIARHHLDFTEWYMEKDRTDREVHDWKKAEFWRAVNRILLDQPSIVGLLTNPQLERAWIHTRETWICILDRQDRQTEKLEETA